MSPEPHPFLLQDERIGRLIRMAHLRKRIGDLILVGGRICAIGADSVDIEGVSRAATLGDLVSEGADLAAKIVGTVVHIEADLTRVMVVASAGLRLGDFLYLRGQPRIFPDVSWVGSIVDGLGRRISGKGAWAPGPDPYDLHAVRADIEVDGFDWPSFKTGIRCVDIFSPLCTGQRIGVFAGSGVGKSTLLSMMMTRAECDVAIIALVGERRREVADFVSHGPPEMLSRSVCVVATSDEPALMRYLAPLTAMSVAEFFKDQGRRVLLVVDSLTRFAHALREILMAGGAAPVARGYPAAVSGHMARLVERAGPGAARRGSITGIFSVLVDGDDHSDPISDAARGFLDGHIVLDRAIAERTQYPPVDILKSLSRLAPRALSPLQLDLAMQARRLAAAYEGTRDLRSMGVYQRGGDAVADASLTIVPKLYEFLSEPPDGAADPDPFAGLARLVGATTPNA